MAKNDKSKEKEVLVSDSETNTNQKDFTVVKTTPPHAVSRYFYTKNRETYCCGKELEKIAFSEFVQIEGNPIIVPVCYECLIRTGHKRILKRGYNWEKSGK